MNKMIIAGCAVATAFAAVAMPTKKEIAQAQKPVGNATKADLAAFKAGQKTAKEVADSHLALAAKAENQAEKYLYYQGAFKLYARSGEFERAADALDGMKRGVNDMSPEVIIELAGEELRYVADEKAPRLLALIDEAKRTASAGREKPQVVNRGISDGKEKVGKYVWSYRVSNGEATIMAEEKDKDGKINSICAISPKPTGLVTIPATLGGSKVSSIGYGAFKGCCGMSSVTIPPDVKDIEPWAFEGCSGLTSMAIPDGVKTIENCAFWGCDGLKSVMIPPSVTTISDAAFGYCGGLTSMTIPPTVKELRTQVFFGCGALKSVTIPASVEKIGWAAFVYSGKLKEINVEQGNQWFISVDGVLYTKDMTELVACPNALTSLTIPSSVKKLRDAAIIGCGKLESLTIPEGVTDIGWQAIKDCGSLKTVTIPSTVRGIAEIAFCNCGSLTSLTIPAGVASIGKRAFENCVALTSVTMCGERPEASDDVFKGCGKLKAIHVPAKAKSWAGMKEWQGVPLVFDAK